MGTLWNRSGTVERYADDLRAAGAKAYFFDGGTTTPMTVFQDAGEASAHPHPLLADANGRWPDVFVPYTLTGYDARVTDAFDVQLTFSQSVPNPNPVDVTVTAPSDQLVQTGMIHAEFVNTTKTGYVRLNGRTLGNAASGATERANADTVNLFTYLWNNLSNTFAPVSAGRGASAAADYAANKTIGLPDMRGGIFLGLDDMGNAAAGAFTGLTFTSGNATTVGSLIGSNGITLTIGNLPAHSHVGSTDLAADHTHSVFGTSSTDSVGHTHQFTNASNTTFNAAAGGTPVFAPPANSTNTSDVSVGHTHSVNFSAGLGGAHSHNFTTNVAGSGTAFNNMAISRLVTWFIKL